MVAEGAGAGAAAAGWKVICGGGGVGVAVLAASLASASLRSLSLVIAAASRSCFSHFEYVLVTAGFDGLGSGEVDTGGVACVSEVTRRLGGNWDCPNGSKRRPTLVTIDCLKGPLCGAGLSGVDDAAHNKLLPEW